MPRCSRATPRSRRPGRSSIRSRRSGRARRHTPTGPASGGRARPTRCWPPREGGGVAHDEDGHEEDGAMTTLWDTTGSAVVKELAAQRRTGRSEEHTSELQSRQYLVCRLLLEKKNK